MKERVTIKVAAEKVLIVCPHGHFLDDEHTNTLSGKIADKLNCNAVINNGWRRSDAVDAIAGRANCNNYKHCKEPVVIDEFLKPINDAISLMFESIDEFSDEPQPLVVCVHGIGNKVRKQSNQPNLDIVVGYGNGTPDRHTCTLWRKNALVDTLANNGFMTFEGAKGGSYSAHSLTNLTQGIHKNNSVDVLQLEFIYAIRSSDQIIEQTASKVAKAINDVMLLSNYTRPSSHKLLEI